MSLLTLDVNTSNLQKALRQMPELLAKNMANAILRVSNDIARSARDKAPKAFSTLTLSIKDTQVSAYEAIITSGVNYAQAVEEGTSGQAMPPVSSIEDWIAVRNIQPQQEGMSQRQLAFNIARSIATNGTPAQPYFKPALEDNRERATRLINDAINAALQGRAA